MLLKLINFFTVDKNKYTYLILYFLSVIIFGIIYWFLGNTETLNFDKQTNDNNDNITFLNALYFSIITQTTTGYGDISPKSKLLRMISFIQLALLVIYIGI